MAFLLREEESDDPGTSFARPLGVSLAQVLTPGSNVSQVRTAGAALALDSSSRMPVNALFGGFRTFTDADTTPSVKDGLNFKTANTGPTTITMFDDGGEGQIITVVFTDAVTTLTDGGNLKLAGAFTSTADDTMQLVFDGTNWFELSRSVN